MTAMNALGLTRRVARRGEWVLSEIFQKFPGIQTRFDGRFAIREIEDARVTLSGIERAATPEGSEGAEGSSMYVLPEASLLVLARLPRLLLLAGQHSTASATGAAAVDRVASF
ncbi:MAG: hypothetical protein KDB11_32305, partial [Planctomycetales bacterium]|nr:hypothetical protein [Planctomycetales bacterium]